ncbi:unnamed protein product [Vitrella brassicaformis CCMP3155]|uniref:1,3-beta-glucan synthase n=2 Tax=Vitrella brassicaformis TaxID=1169539 RepID=A0A0G4FS46_VITBC|nr:unnamed protein product [Vitrella brassicaformis CCMP3155]|eukprot:CEM17504.1 unnamed protein product [Vitrella brassicaformis CCMP3155]
MAQRTSVPAPSWLTWPEEDTSKKNFIDVIEGRLISDGLPTIRSNPDSPLTTFDDERSTDPVVVSTSPRGKADDAGQLLEYETIIRNILRLFRTPGSSSGRVGGSPTVFEEMVHKFRFQEDNYLNQYEDVVYTLISIALRDYPPTNETTRAMRDRGFSRLEEYALYRYHWKLFKNYRRWCQYVNIKPFPWGENKAKAGKGLTGAVAAFEKDKEKQRKNPKTLLQLMAREIALWKLMWGESANLRHCPEMLLFIFHWMVKSWDDVDPATLPTFIETITPVINEFWEEMRRAQGDHPVKMNYEDFNEIFHKAPVVQEYLGVAGKPGTGGVWQGNIIRLIKAESQTHQLVKLHPPKGRKKTFVEQRSYLHFFRTWWRFYHFHLVSLLIILTLGARARGWDWQGWWGTVAVGSSAGSAVREMLDLFFYWMAPVPLLQRLLDAQEGMQRMSWWARQGMAGLRWGFFLAAAYVSHTSPSGLADPLLQPQGYIGGGYMAFYLLHGLSYFLVRARKAFPWWRRSPPTWSSHATFSGNATMLSDEYKHMMAYALFWGPIISFKLWMGYYFFGNAFLDYLEFIDATVGQPLKFDFLWFSFDDNRKVTLYFFWVAPFFVLYFYDIMFYFSVFQSGVSWLIGWFRGIGFITDLSVIQKVFPLLPIQYDRVLSDDAGGSMRQLKLPTSASPNISGCGIDWLLQLTARYLCCGLYSRKSRSKVKPKSYFRSHSRPNYALPLRNTSRSSSRQPTKSRQPTDSSNTTEGLKRKPSQSFVPHSRDDDSLTNVLIRYIPVSPRADPPAQGSSTAPRRGLQLLGARTPRQQETSSSPSTAPGSPHTVPSDRSQESGAKKTLTPGAVDTEKGLAKEKRGSGSTTGAGGGGGKDDVSGGKRGGKKDGEGRGWVSWWIREISAVYDNAIPPETVENQIRRFGFLWNEVVESWREEDLIDNAERCKLQFNELPAIHFKDLKDLNMACCDGEGNSNGSVSVSWDGSDIRHPVWVYCDVLKSFTRECEAHQTHINEIWEGLRDHYRSSNDSHQYLQEVLKLPPSVATRGRWSAVGVKQRAKASLHQTGKDFITKLFGNSRATVADPRADSHQFLLRTALLEIYEALCLYLTRFFPGGSNLALRLSSLVQRVTRRPFCLSLLNLAAIKDLQTTLAAVFAAAQGDNAAKLEENGVKLLKALQKVALPALLQTRGSSVLSSKGMAQHFPELVEFLEAVGETLAVRQSFKSVVNASDPDATGHSDVGGVSEAETELAVANLMERLQVVEPPSPEGPLTPRMSSVARRPSNSITSSRHGGDDDTPTSSYSQLTARSVVRDPRGPPTPQPQRRGVRPPLPVSKLSGFAEDAELAWIDTAAEAGYCDKLWRLEELQEGVRLNHPLSLSEALKPFFRRASRILTAQGHVLKTGLAQARLKYFSSSLFMEMPEAPSVQRMVSMCTFTPTYTEDAMLDSTILNEKTMEGVRQFDFIRTMYSHEWANFLERMDPQGVRYEWYQHSQTHKGVLSKNINDMAAKFEKDIEEWASDRSQTLWRTLRSVMYYEQACRMLAWMELQEQRGEAVHLCHDRNMLSFEQNERLNWQKVPIQPDSPKKLQVFLRHWERCRSRKRVLDFRPYDNDPVAKALATLRYHYVLTAQTLGDDMKAPPSNRVASLRVRCITEMCKRFPNLRVAAIESCDVTLPGSGPPSSSTELVKWSPSKETSPPPPGKTKTVRCSVLYKWDVSQQRLVRVYRIVLGLLEGTSGAKNPIVGEGKSENQNHAVIFTRGETVQAIDMNQEMYLEEALKLRNLLQEFAKDSNMAIVGFREHAFLPAAVAPSYLSNISQTLFTAFDARAFHMPMRVRFHYGHPDVLDRYLVQTIGGMSRGSAIINVTEDVYCGMNYVQRGYSVSQVDYIMCSKGWPNDLDQVVAFMRKISCGLCEAQVASRDAYRMAYGFDFFRMLSLFAVFPGWNILNPLALFAIWLFCYGRLFLHAFIAAIPDEIRPLVVGMDSALVTIMDRIWLILLGLFYMRFFAVVALEEGLGEGFKHMWQHVRSLSLLHYTFSVGTWTSGFDETILFGRAKYQNAGRGFSINHKDLIHLWKSYFYSHFQVAIELLLLLFYLHFLQDMHPVIGMHVWWLWFVVVSFLYVPHLYNPMGLSWGHLISDFSAWQNWIRSKNKHDPNESWYAWWRAQMEFRNGAAPFNKVVIFIRQWRFMLLGLCFAEAAHWEWHHILASPSMIQGKLTVPTWEGAWEMVQQSPLLAPVIFVILLIVSMALSTHNRDHHPKFYNPKDTRHGLMSLMSSTANRLVSLIVRVVCLVLVGLFLYFLIGGEGHGLAFGTVVGGMVACLLAFFCVANLLAECFGVLEWPVVVETIRLWHFVLGIAGTSPLIALAALKYLFNSSELQMYYLLNSYGVRRSLLHMGHVGKMLHKIRREQKHPYAYNSKTQGTTARRGGPGQQAALPDHDDHDAIADHQQRGAADEQGGTLPAFGKQL